MVPKNKTSNHKPATRKCLTKELILLLLCIFFIFVGSTYIILIVYNQPLLPNQPAPIPQAPPPLTDNQRIKNKYAQDEIGNIDGQEFINLTQLPDELRETFIFDEEEYEIEDIQVEALSLDNENPGYRIAYQITSGGIGEVYELLFRTVHSDNNWTQKFPTPTTATAAFVEFSNHNYLVHVELTKVSDQIINVLITAKLLNI